MYIWAGITAGHTLAYGTGKDKADCQRDIRRQELIQWVEGEVPDELAEDTLRELKKAQEHPRS
jgi:hypothetical protein